MTLIWLKSIERVQAAIKSTQAREGRKLSMNAMMMARAASALRELMPLQESSTVNRPAGSNRLAVCVVNVVSGFVMDGAAMNGGAGTGLLSRGAGGE